VKERIREAALDLFAEKGYYAVSVRDICREADTTLPMVYYYFGNKRGLYDALLDEAIERRVRRLQAACRYQGDVVDRLRVLLEAWASPDEANLPRHVQMFYLRELTGLGAGLNTDSIDRIDRELRRAIRTILQDGIDAGIFRPMRVPMVALAMIGIVSTFRRRMLLGARVTVEDGLEQVTDTLLHGLLVRETAGHRAAVQARRTEA
jgi:AcrR family transcriptional regulator